MNIVNIQRQVFSRSSFQTAGQWQIMQPVERNTRVVTSVSEHTTSGFLTWIRSFGFENMSTENTLF